MQNHFTVIVAGNNPDSIIEQYDRTRETTPYLVYEFSKAKEYHEKYINYYETALKTNDLSETVKENLKVRLEELKLMDDIGFYTELTEVLDIDQNTGNAYSSENIDGKYDTCRIGKNLAMPLINNNGEEVFSCKKGDVDFSKIHMYNVTPYQVAWEVVVEGRKPHGSEEERIYENMKNRTAYFENFKDKETYIAWSCAFWAYAFVDKYGWHEFEGDLNDQIKWVTEFYDKFIKKLPKNTLLTVYECTRF